MVGEGGYGSRNAKQGANEILWEHGNTGQPWNGKKEQGPPTQDPWILEKNLC